ncbi:MAG: ABC transporter permease subunit, partial [Elusimicrobia bacterium]|nr:ABC transporter permease subunit [Elusimicrobiota bacterium]
MIKRIFLIAQKEFKRYFDSPIAYITILVFLLISGWMFSSTLFLMNRATIQNFAVNVPLLLLFLAPAIAMQLLAGEFNQGTMEVLGSLPVKDEEIIAGKFIAAFALMSLAIILTLIYPITVASLGKFDWGQGVGTYLGMILIGGAFLAAGLFASALTSNQVVAFILGFLFSFTLFL